MATEREAWLKLTVEAPIDPDLPICDAHHHLYDNLNQRYLPDDLLHDIGRGHRVLQTVFIECKSMYRPDGPEQMKPVGETEAVYRMTARAVTAQDGPTAVAAGIVGFADLSLGPGVVPVLEAHIAACGDRFRGIRRGCSWDASPAITSYNKVKGLMLDPKFREGFAYLQRYGLSFEAWQYHTQLMELLDLARAFPDTAIIVNHTGGPLGVGPYAGKRKEVFQEWKHGMSALATCPNITVKLGGLGMPLCGFGWHERSKPPGSAELAEVMAPYYRFCIERFGVDRCMFESNFPADKVSYPYTVLWNAFKRISADCSPKDRAALFHDTAVRVYRLASGHQR